MRRRNRRRRLQRRMRRMVTSMLDRIERIVVIMFALPVAMRDKARSLLNAERERDVLRVMNEETMGMLDEARSQRNHYREEARVAVRDRDFAKSEVTALRDELKIVSLERDGFRADANESAREFADVAKELGCPYAGGVKERARAVIIARNEALRDRDMANFLLATIYEIGWRAIVERDTARTCLDIEHEHTVAMTKDIAAARATIDAITEHREAEDYAGAKLRGRLADMERERDLATKWKYAAEAEANMLRAELATLRSKVEPAPAESCAWCLSSETGDGYSISDVSGGHGWLPLCAKCNSDNAFTSDDVRARARLRRECCPSRRTSPDPLAVACTLGCGAPAGQQCDPYRSEGAIDGAVSLLSQRLDKP